MTKRSLRTGALLAFLLGAGPAAAGTLTAATWTQTVHFFGAVPAQTIGQLGATGTSTATAINVNLSYPQLTSSFFVPKTPNEPVTLHERLTQGGPQDITATPGMANGMPGVPGTLVVMTGVHDGMGVNQSMFKVGTNTIIQVPINVGATGQFTGTLTVLGVNGALTIDFYAWTPGTVSFTNLTTKGVALPDVVAMGSFDLTPEGGGTVTLVSPAKISADCALLQMRAVLSLATLKLSFVPEPGALLLLAAGAVGLTVAGRRRT